MSSLEAQAAERKNRLQQLRKRKAPTTKKPSTIDQKESMSIVSPKEEPKVQETNTAATSEPKEALDQQISQELDNDRYEEVAVPARPPKKRQLVSRNYDPQSKLPVNSFDARILKVQVAENVSVEVVSTTEENEIVQKLSRKYNLDQDDEEVLPVDAAGSDEGDDQRQRKLKVTRDFEIDLREQKEELDNVTDRAIRRMVRERIKGLSQ